ncbi:hypothetical protein CDD83_462 [Cordyceps sp. RAO-2017]|nr:hypothetical protein CDD83_462 [Cordyceps sp. RAO-2017]
MHLAAILATGLASLALAAPAERGLCIEYVDPVPCLRVLHSCILPNHGLQAAKECVALKLKASGDDALKKDAPAE